MNVLLNALVSSFALMIGLTPAPAAATDSDAESALALAAAKRVRSLAPPCICGSDCPCLPGDCPAKCMVVPKSEPTYARYVPPVAVPFVSPGRLLPPQAVGVMPGFRWGTLPGVGYGWIQDGVTPRATSPAFPTQVFCPGGVCPKR